jgi:chaperonin cofactor prefoldin
VKEPEGKSVGDYGSLYDIPLDSSVVYPSVKAPVSATEIKIPQEADPDKPRQVSDVVSPKYPEEIKITTNELFSVQEVPENVGFEESERHGKRHSTSDCSQVSLETPLQKPDLNYKRTYTPSSPSEVESEPVLPRAKSLECSVLGSESFIPRLSLEPPTPPKRVKPSVLSLESAQIKVKDHRRISEGYFGMKSYVIYDIEVIEAGLSWTIDRRFSDFDWLNTQLSLIYKGLMIPPLPKKKWAMFGSKDDFIEGRRAQLEIYLCQIASHPVLSKSEAYLCFIHRPQTEFLEARESITKREDWFEYTSLEDLVDSFISDVRSKVIGANKKSPSNEVASIELNLNILTGPTKTLTSAFKGWVSSVVETGKANELFEVLGKDFTQQLKDFDDEVEQRLEACSKQLNAEQSRAEALRSPITAYKSTLVEYAKNEEFSQRKRAKFLHANSDNSDEYQRQVSSTQTKIDTLKLTLNEIERRLIDEKNRFTSMRTTNMSLILRQLSQSMVISSQEAALLWSSSAS